MNPSEAPRSCSRRSFVRTSAAALAGISIVPRRVLGGPGYVPPSDKITTACIGVGAQGTRVMLDFLKQADIQVVSVCDVNKGSDLFVEWWPGELHGKVRHLLDDTAWANGVQGCLAGLEPAQEIVQRHYTRGSDKPTYKGCSAYTDYRALLDQETDLDAVIIATPDHTHAVVALAAMRQGKHVYCQKPMTHTVREARAMAEVARKTGVATQVATGNSASEDTRLLREWIGAGVIGPVRAVHNWSSRPFWPQGIERPEETPPVPDYLDWNGWLGPALHRPYHPIYQPFVWRGWYDFGAGAIGDMGCYSFDTLFRVLQLDAPTRVEASSTKTFDETFPVAAMLHFHFPARAALPPVTIHWYDGGLKPPKPDELGNDDLAAEGMLFVGDAGKILCGFMGENPRLIPASAMEAFAPPPKTLPRSIGHDKEWIAACRGGAPAAATFEFAGRVTETILLGNVALRAGKTLHWNPDAFAITNDADANALLHMPYRDGWSLEG